MTFQRDFDQRMAWPSLQGILRATHAHAHERGHPSAGCSPAGDSLHTQSDAFQNIPPPWLQVETAEAGSASRAGHLSSTKCGAG